MKYVEINRQIYYCGIVLVVLIVFTCHLEKLPYLGKYMKISYTDSDEILNLMCEDIVIARE